jgi:hypothetical protein
MPGMKKSLVKIMLIPRSLPEPRFLKVRMGVANMIKIMVAILIVFFQS